MAKKPKFSGRRRATVGRPPSPDKYPHQVYLEDYGVFHLCVYDITQSDDGREWLRAKLWTPFDIAGDGEWHSFWLTVTWPGGWAATGNRDWARLWKQDPKMKSWALDRLKNYCRMAHAGLIRLPGEKPSWTK